MASGKASKASVTLLTTQPGVGLLSSAVVEDPAWAAKINSLIPGGRPLFTASNKEESSPPDGLIAALVDGYVGIFLSVTNGFALMGDVGFNIIKFEHANVELAWGARVPAAAVLASPIIAAESAPRFLWSVAQALTRTRASTSGKRAAASASLASAPS